MNVEHWIERSARNPVFVLICVVGLSLFAIGELSRVPLDALPDLSDVQVIIYTEWPGRSPDLVEDQVTYPIASRLIGAPRVKWVRGESTFGKSFVYVIFQDGTDLYWARSRVLEYLGGLLASLPLGVQPRLGPDATGVGWVYEYALVDESGTYDLATLRALQDWTLRYALNSVPGVAEVATVGGYLTEYQLQLDPKRLIAYDVSIPEVIQAIQKGNQESGGGSFEVSTTEQVIRGRGYYRSLRDIGKTVIKVGPKGVPILAEQVGYLTLGAAPRRGAVELNGRGECVGGIVIMRQGENALRVIEGVRKKLEEILPALPHGVRVVPTYDRSELIHRAIATLARKLIEESVIVLGVCALFLWHLRSALVIVCMLPIAILLSFLPFRYLGLTANIMSLGGIAIAIGAMVDSGIVMVEAAHKEIEKEEALRRRPIPEERRRQILVEAARSMGRPLFFALLVLTVSFFPVFGLEAQEGRLFRPLALTKTFSMLSAAFLSVTLVPVLMLLLVRGRIWAEECNPVSRVTRRLYVPILEVVLQHPWGALLIGAFCLASLLYPLSRIGAEFMPPLNEGTLLYMPTGVPGVSITEAVRILELQDRELKSFPEVEQVFGKIGSADTATDPAPLSMVETIVTLKPPHMWRPGMDWEKLIAEMNAKLRYPGMANIFWMPIQTRTEMLTTGMRSKLGLKIYGEDWRVLDELGQRIEEVLGQVPGTRSVYSERLSAGRYLDIEPKREELARYGLSVEEIGELIGFALGGTPVTTMVLGRQRYPVTVRLARDFRQDELAIGMLPIPVAPSKAAPEGEGPMPENGDVPPLQTRQIPLSTVASLGFRSGPPSLRSENGKLVQYVFVDPASSDIAGYVEKASRKIRDSVSMPLGYHFQWSGSYESYQRAKERLSILIPVTIGIIFLLLYLNTRSLTQAILVLLAVPFSLVGAFWLLYLLHYNISVGVAVGLIALAGLDAETGVVMLLYLELSYLGRKDNGRMRGPEDLKEAIREGAAGRLRPKLMTVSAILFGLLPILWETGTGADLAKRIAAPMVGGVLSSAIGELLLYPAIYLLWRRAALKPSAC
jgi:Cu(I)/Ag(I) efflux system membrane protein CusA/SilA